MGLLMSDTLLIDPLPDDTLRLRDRLSTWAYTLDVASDSYDYEAADPTEWPRLVFPTAAVASDAGR